MKKTGIFAALLVFASVMISAQNMVSNGEFTKNVSPWQTYCEGGKAKLSAKNGEMEMAVSSIGKVFHGAQAYYDAVKLENGASYKFSFDAYATAERVIGWRFQLNGGDYRGYAGDGELVKVGTSKQHFEYTFTMTEKTDPRARLCINAGKWDDGPASLPAHSIFIDNIKLEKN